MEDTSLLREQGVSTPQEKKEQREKWRSSAEGMVLAGPSISWRMLPPSCLLTYSAPEHLFMGRTLQPLPLPWNILGQ